MVDIAFIIYHVQETRTLKQDTVFLETVRVNQKERRDLKGRRKDPLGVNQCTYTSRRALGERTAQDSKGKLARIEILAEKYEQGGTG